MNWKGRIPNYFDGENYKHNGTMLNDNMTITDRTITWLHDMTVGEDNSPALIDDEPGRIARARRLRVECSGNHSAKHDDSWDDLAECPAPILCCCHLLLERRLDIHVHSIIRDARLHAIPPFLNQPLQLIPHVVFPWAVDLAGQINILPGVRNRPPHPLPTQGF